jgi:hypothetical protein
VVVEKKTLSALAAGRDVGRNLNIQNFIL